MKVMAADEEATAAAALLGLASDDEIISGKRCEKKHSLLFRIIKILFHFFISVELGFPVQEARVEGYLFLSRQLSILQRICFSNPRNPLSRLSLFKQTQDVCQTQ